MTMIALLSVMISANAQDKVLKNIDETNIGEYSMEYNYREDGLIDNRIGNDFYGTYKVTFHYDDNNNVIKRELYSDNMFGGWILNSYVCYEYNGDGKVTRRQNWNMNDEGEFAENPDGDEFYEYNDDGTLKQTEMHLFMGSDYKPYNRIKYSYDTGKLVKREIMSGLELVNDNYDIYEYDVKGRLIFETNYAYSGETAMPYTNIRYTYDRNSNLLSHAYLLTGVVQDSTYYVYSQEKAEDYIYPYDLEEPQKYMDYMYNRIDGYVVFNLEEASGELVKSQDYKFTYGDMTSVDNVIKDNENRISVVADSDFGIVFGLEDRNADFSVTDMKGTVVCRGKLNNGTFGTYLMDKGIYLLNVGGKCVKFKK